MSHAAHQYSRVDFYSSLEVNLSLYYGGVELGKGGCRNKEEEGHHNEQR